MGLCSNEDSDSIPNVAVETFLWKEARQRVGLETRIRILV